MKSEDKKTLYISIAMIIFLATVSFWRFKRIGNADFNFSLSSYKEIGVPNFDDIFSEENLEEIAKKIDFGKEEEEKNIIYARQVIKDRVRFDYPSSWAISSEENLKDLNVLFVAYADKVVYPSVIAVIEMETDNPETAVEMFKEEIEKEGKILDASFQEISENEYFSTISVDYSKELKGSYTTKVFLIDDKCYLFSVTFFGEKLSTSQIIIDYIISSIQIIN